MTHNIFNKNKDLEDKVSDVVKFFCDLQSDLTNQIQQLEPVAIFKEDSWKRHNSASHGATIVMEEGKIIEKCGVNFSYIEGDALPVAATEKRRQLVGKPFVASGVSLVLHPYNPHAPTVHMNVRFFIGQNQESTPIWWFGGGWDLTPHYGYLEDCIHWHQQSKTVCESYESGTYLQYKKWCDDYFHLPHRKEQRGIGGIFFDDLTGDFEKVFSFIKAVGLGFAPAYLPILNRRKNMIYLEKERSFQNYRRGRYVEFNLIHDRGTLFGLQFGGRTESILMSMPPIANWKYRHQPEKGSVEAKLVSQFLTPKNWVD